MKCLPAVHAMSGWTYFRLMPFTHPVQGPVAIPGYPVQFGKCQAGTRSAAPKLGEHTDLILKNLGYSGAEIESLKIDKVIQ